jgi:hypothetical protein
MAGSAGIAAWIAQIAFWALLLIGVGSGEIGRKGGALFAALWLGGYLAVQVAPAAAMLFTPYLAVVDLVLVFVIFKGDVRLN